MSVKMEKKEKSTIEFEIEVDSKRFEDAVNKSYQKNAKRFNVPGFRKGKAPRNMIERYYGVEILYEDAINIACGEAYLEAVNANNITPVDKPSIDIKQIGIGKNLIFTATVTVKPEFEVAQYKGVEVEKVEADVTEEQIETELNKVAQKNARIISVEDRGIQKGDIANIDFEGFIDGVPFEGGKADGYSLEIGSGQFIPGFEDQLIGTMPADDVEVNVSFPEDYGNKGFAGKAALFKVIINEIKYKELPVIDDEFAKDVSEFDTLEEYKADIKNKLMEVAQNNAKVQLQDKVVDNIVDNTDLEIPQIMIEKQIDRILVDFDMKLRNQGLDLKKYLGMSGLELETFRGSLAERAEKEVKIQLILEKISKLENMEVSEEEFDQEVKNIGEHYGQNEDFKQHLSPDDIEYIKESIIFRKTVEMLTENAKLS